MNKKSLLDDIKTKQLQSYGHVQRLEQGRLPKEVMKWSPPGRRKQGRPQLNWAEGIRAVSLNRRAAGFGTGPWHQLYRAARGSPGICHFSFSKQFSLKNVL